MDVILLQQVDHLGKLGDRVSVKPGYARNFLLPTGLAQPATEANLAAFAAKRAELEAQQAQILDKAKAKADQLQAIDNTIHIAGKAGKEGKLFGSIGTQEIAKAITDAGVTVDRKMLVLPERIRALGEFTIELKLHSKLSVQLNVLVENPD